MVEEVEQVDAVQATGGGQLDHVESPPPGLALRDERGVGVKAAGDLLLGQPGLLPRRP
jgi:hypothetical protein